MLTEFEKSYFILICNLSWNLHFLNSICQQIWLLELLKCIQWPWIWSKQCHHKSKSKCCCWLEPQRPIGAQSSTCLSHKYDNYCHSHVLQPLVFQQSYHRVGKWMWILLYSWSLQSAKNGWLMRGDTWALAVMEHVRWYWANVEVLPEYR